MSAEDLQSIKDDIKNDLSRGYYKMSQTKIIALVGCTITACLSFFSGAMYIDRNFTAHEIRLNNHDNQIKEMKDLENKILNNEYNFYKDKK